VTAAIEIARIGHLAGYVNYPDNVPDRTTFLLRSSRLCLRIRNPHPLAASSEPRHLPDVGVLFRGAARENLSP